MNVVELLQEVGVDDITYQALDACASKMDWDRKKGTTITFHSDVRLTPSGTEEAGIVVWVPRDKLTAALEKTK